MALSPSQVLPQIALSSAASRESVAWGFLVLRVWGRNHMQLLTEAFSDLKPQWNCWNLRRSLAVTLGCVWHLFHCLTFSLFDLRGVSWLPVPTGAGRGFFPLSFLPWLSCLRDGKQLIPANDVACRGSVVPNKNQSKWVLRKCRFILYSTFLLCLYWKVLLVLICSGWTTVKFLSHDTNSIQRYIWQECSASSIKDERREILSLFYRGCLGTLSY